MPHRNALTVCPNNHVCSANVSNAFCCSLCIYGRSLNIAYWIRVCARSALERMILADSHWMDGRMASSWFHFRLHRLYVWSSAVRPIIRCRFYRCQKRDAHAFHHRRIIHHCWLIISQLEWTSSDRAHHLLSTAFSIRCLMKILASDPAPSDFGAKFLGLLIWSDSQPRTRYGRTFTAFPATSMLLIVLTNFVCSLFL